MFPQLERPRSKAPKTLMVELILGREKFSSDRTLEVPTEMALQKANRKIPKNCNCLGELPAFQTISFGVSFQGCKFIKNHGEGRIHSNKRISQKHWDVCYIAMQEGRKAPIKCYAMERLILEYPTSRNPLTSFVAFIFQSCSR